MPDSPNITSLELQREHILADIATLGDMRPGSLVHRYMKCSTPSCRCRQEGDPGHGPYFVLVRDVGGKRTSRSLSKAAAEAVQPQLDEYQRFRRLSAALVEVSEQLADARSQHSGGDTQGVPKKACAQEFVPAIEDELARFVAPGASDAVDFEALETRLRSRALELAARAVERRFDEDCSDHCGPHRPCPCGQTAHYAGRRAKTFTTVLGALTLQRAYYHCPACRHGCFPRDRALGMARTDLSPGVTRMTGTAAALVSFAQASSLLDELAGVQVGSKHVQRTAQALGREIAALERQSPGSAAAAPAPTVYLGVDGTGVPVRASETVGRAGKQPDGSARTREVKLVVVWTAESRDDEGRAVRDPGSVSYTAAVESAASRDTDPDPSEFAQRMRREAQRRGFPLARRRVILGDGANWIWRIAGEDHPGAIQIVDLWHAKENCGTWPRHSSAATRRSTRHGRTPAARISSRVASTACSPPCGRTLTAARKPPSAPTTSTRTAAACAIPSSAHKGCA